MIIYVQFMGFRFVCIFENAVHQCFKPSIVRFFTKSYISEPVLPAQSVLDIFAMLVYGQDFDFD